MIFAFTVKGLGLPIAGHPMNHSAVLTGDQIDALRLALADPARRVGRLRPGHAGRRSARRRGAAR